jgi:hypothetical protein
VPRLFLGKIFLKGAAGVGTPEPATPLLLACILRRSPVHAAILINQVFSVTFLADSQMLVAETFAGRHRGVRSIFAARRGRMAALPPFAARRFAVPLPAATVSRDGTHAIFVGIMVREASLEATPIDAGQTYARPPELTAAQVAVFHFGDIK